MATTDRTSYGALPSYGSIHESTLQAPETSLERRVSPWSGFAKILTVLVGSLALVALVFANSTYVSPDQAAVPVLSLSNKAGDGWWWSVPTNRPTSAPTRPTPSPTVKPSPLPTTAPSAKPTTATPTWLPTAAPSVSPTKQPTPSPTAPTKQPTPSPTAPTPLPTLQSERVTQCSSVGTAICEKHTLLASSPSGLQYSGFKGTAEIPSAKLANTKIGAVYYSSDDGATSVQLSAADACTKSFTTYYDLTTKSPNRVRGRQGSYWSYTTEAVSFPIQQTLGGLAAGEDSDYAYLWYVCNPNTQYISTFAPTSRPTPAPTPKPTFTPQPTAPTKPTPTSKPTPKPTPKPSSSDDDQSDFGDSEENRRELVSPGQYSKTDFRRETAPRDDGRRLRYDPAAARKRTYKTYKAKYVYQESLVVGLCRASLSSKSKFTCSSFLYPTSEFESRFRTIRSVSSSTDGSVVGIVGDEGGLVVCKKSAGALSVSSCEYKSKDAFADVAFDSTGTKILVAPQTGFNLYTGNVAQFSSAMTATPKLAGPNNIAASWSSCAASDNFKSLACAQYGGYVYASSDSGATWAASSKTYFFGSLAMSGSGDTIVAGSPYSKPYLATSTFGLTWTDQSSCVSSYPTLAVSLTSGDSFFSSRDISMIKHYETNCVAGDKDCGEYDFCYLYQDSAMVYRYMGGSKTIYKSTLTYSDTSSNSTAYDDDFLRNDDAVNVIEDYADGWTWTTINTTESASYASATVSSDGAVIVAVIGEGSIQVSDDAGESWKSSHAAGKHVDWSDVITNADGSVIVAVSHEGLIYTSTDTGNTFTQADVAEDNFVSVKCSR